MTNYSLKQTIESVLRKAYAKKGPLFAEIMINWKSIIGAEMSDQIEPYNIKHYIANGEKVASLALKLEKNANILEIQFSKMIILERINNYFGYRAISEIRFS